MRFDDAAPARRGGAAGARVVGQKGLKLEFSRVGGASAPASSKNLLNGHATASIKRSVHSTLGPAAGDVPLTAAG